MKNFTLIKEHTSNYFDEALFKKFIAPLLNKNSENDNITFINLQTIAEHKGTFPVEIIKCKYDDESAILLFCKRGKKRNISHRRPGVDYERRIYSEVLPNASTSTVKFYGSFQTNSTDVWIVLEYLKESVNLKGQSLYAHLKAAEWIGEFHNCFDSKPPIFIKKYDISYYEKWVDYVQPFAEQLVYLYSWLPELCAAYRQNLRILTDAPQTVIHGEYYPRNILLNNGIIYPVDWESAAYAPGEIDIVGLTDDMKVGAKETINRYMHARWENCTQDIKDFEKRLAMARVYLQFRWVGGWRLNCDTFKDWLSTPSYRDRLYKAAKVIGVLE